jgi:tetratricopeptide (TPR) repeat protein
VYAYQIGLCYALLDKWDKAKEYWASAPDYITKKKRPVEVLLARQAKTFIDVTMAKKTRNSEAMLAAINMMNMWNGFSQMPQAAIAKALAALDDAAKVGEFNTVDTARYNMLRGAILHALNKDEEAVALLTKVIGQADDILGSDAGKQCAAIPMAYAELATIHLAMKGKDGKPAPEVDKANAAIKAAAAIKGYDMYRTVQLKLHALRNLASNLGKGASEEAKADDVDDAREKMIEAHLNDETEPEEVDDEHL